MGVMSKLYQYEQVDARRTGAGDGPAETLAISTAGNRVVMAERLRLML